MSDIHLFIIFLLSSPTKGFFFSFFFLPRFSAAVYMLHASFSREDEEGKKTFSPSLFISRLCLEVFSGNRYLFSIQRSNFFFFIIFIFKKKIYSIYTCLKRKCFRSSLTKSTVGKKTQTESPSRMNLIDLGRLNLAKVS